MECMFATILHEDPDVIPQFEGFMDRNASLKFSPRLTNIKNQTEKVVRRAKFLDRFTIGCGTGGFKAKVVEKQEQYRILEWETGARWKMIDNSVSSFTRKYIHYPIIRDEDLDKLQLPDPDDPERYSGIKSKVKYYTDKGFFTACGINGFFAGVWYFLRPFNLWMRDLVSNRGFAKKIIDELGEFNIKVAKNCLETGVHSIEWCDDLGYNKGMFISPETYEEIIYPWHRKLIHLAHKWSLC